LTRCKQRELEQSNTVCSILFVLEKSICSNTYGDGTEILPLPLYVAIDWPVPSLATLKVFLYGLKQDKLLISFFSFPLYSFIRKKVAFHNDHFFSELLDFEKLRHCPLHSGHKTTNFALQSLVTTDLFLHICFVLTAY
jgi:hypothetical protein